MRILVLILASDTAPEYSEFQKSWAMYMNRTPGVDCYFYKGDPTLEQDAVLKGNTLHIKIEESWLNVYEKTMRAFRFFEPTLSTYDFVFRTNLSSYLDIPAYIAFCATLPRTECCAAVVGRSGTISFPSGSGYTITPDLIRRLLAENPPRIVEDDVTVGLALQTWGIQIRPVNRADYDGTTWAGLDGSPIFHYRVKSENRRHDTDILRSLVENGKPIVVDESFANTPLWMLHQKFGYRRP